MAFSAAAFGAAAVTAAGAILKFEAENVLQDGPNALVEPSTGGAIPSVAQAIARQTCRRYADGVPGLAEGTAVDLERVCRPYLDNIGYGSGPRLLKPFEGGQCDELIYFVTTSLFNPVNQTTATFTGLARGPIGGVRLTPLGGAGAVLSITCRGYSPGPGCQGNQPPLQPLGSFDIASVPANRENPRLVSVVPCGFADNCGNPPPEFTEPEPPESPDPPTEPFNPGPDVDIDITVNLRPDSLIEVNLGLGPIVAPVFGGGGDDGGDPGGGGEPGPDPDTSPPAPEPGPENPGGNGGFGGDDMFGPPPAGRRWVGCCIRITQAPSNASVIATSEPEDVYPTVIGNIRLVCDAAGNRLTDTPVRILAKHVCVWEPVQKLNPVGVSVDLLPGYGYTFRPYSVPSGD